MDRIEFIIAVGTKRAATPPPIPNGRRALIQEAFDLGFRTLHGARIAYGNLVGVQTSQWALDDKYPIDERLSRFSKFIRHFGEFPLEALRSLGERLSAAHGLAALHPDKAQAAAMSKISLDRLLWREGLAAEQHMPRVYASVDALQDTMRHGLADWADFDMLAAHYAYGYDLMCTDDKGNPRSNRSLVRVMLPI